VPLLGHGTGVPRFDGVADALAEPGTQVRLFGKPICEGERRLAVSIATGATAADAKARATRAAEAITIHLD